MTGTSSDRASGNALLIGGVAWTTALLLHPDASTAELARGIGGGRWALAHYLYLIGDVMLIGGLVGFRRSLSAADGGAHAAVAAIAVSAAVMGFFSDVGSTAMHLFGVPIGTQMDAANAATTYDTAMLVSGALSGASFLLIALGLVLIGWTLKRAAWPASVSIPAMVVGTAMVLLSYVLPAITGAALLPVGLAGTVINALVPLGYAWIGMQFAGRSS